MKLKKRFIIIIILGLVGCQKTASYDDYNVVEIPSSFQTVMFVDAIDQSDLIMTISPVSNIKPSDTIIKKNKDGMVYDGYSLREHKVKQVFKGQYSEKTIKVVEAVYFDKQNKKIFEIYTDAYKNIMKVGNDYTVFLQKNTDGSYGIMGAGTSRIDYTTPAQNESYSKNKELINAIFDHKDSPTNGVIKSTELKCNETKDILDIETSVCKLYFPDEGKTYVEINNNKLMMIEGNLKE